MWGPCYPRSASFYHNIDNIHRKNKFNLIGATDKTEGIISPLLIEPLELYLVKPTGISESTYELTRADQEHELNHQDTRLALTQLSANEVRTRLYGQLDYSYTIIICVIKRNDKRRKVRSVEERAGAKRKC